MEEITSSEKVGNKSSSQISMWDYINTALWGYSLFFILVALVGSIFPHKAEPKPIFSIIAFIQIAFVFIFLSGVVLHSNLYTWKWWMKVLGCYSFVITLILMLELMHPIQIHQAHFSFGGALIFLPVFIFILFIGRQKSIKKLH